MVSLLISAVFKADDLPSGKIADILIFPFAAYDLCENSFLDLSIHPFTFSILFEHEKVKKKIKKKKTYLLNSVADSDQWDPYQRWIRIRYKKRNTT